MEEETLKQIEDLEELYIKNIILDFYIKIANVIYLKSSLNL